jgi:hypothetical protein
LKINELAWSDPEAQKKLTEAQQKLKKNARKSPPILAGFSFKCPHDFKVLASGRG